VWAELGCGISINVVAWLFVIFMWHISEEEKEEAIL